MWVANAVSAIGVESPEPVRASDTINMDAQTTGAKAANFFAGFTSPATTIVSSSGHKFAKAADGQSQTLISTYACCDSEITARLARGGLYLRYDPTTTKAIGLSIFANGTVMVGVTLGMNTSNINLAQPFYAHSSAQNSVALPGWVASSENDTFTLGVTGFDVYVKWNGVEVFRYKEYLLLDPGYCMAWAHPNSSGVGDLTLAYVPTTMLGSNRAKKVIDLRDVGPLKASLTTGSMSAGSNQLTVASATGFAVGDPVIVEIGGEASGGQRGAKGVGGASPALSFATTAALLATTQAEGTWAWAEDTGLVQIYQSGAWGEGALYRTNYTNKALPRALKATITAIAGNVLTLSATAAVATTNASVHFDNSNAFLPLTSTVATAVKPAGVTVKLPAGNYAMGSALALTAPTGCTFTGAGKTLSKLFSPKGLVPIQIYGSSLQYLTIKDMALEGNHKLGQDGFPYGFQMSSGDPPGSENYPHSVDFGLTTGVIINDIAFRDIWQDCVALSTGLNNRVNRCTLYMEAPTVQYTQWYFSSNSGAVGDEFRDCEVLYCPSLIKAFESFSAINAKFINCGGYNVLCSSNSAGGTVYDGFHSDIYANCFYQLNAGYPGEPVMNMNHNAYPDSPLNRMPGQIINPRIIQHAKINYLAGGSCQAAIKVANLLDGWTITGQYGSDTTPFVTTKGGYLEAPDWVSGDFGEGAVGVMIDANNCTVSGIRSVGASSNRANGGYIWGNFTLRGTGTVAINNIGDVLSATQATSPTLSGNRTNAGVAVP